MDDRQFEQMLAKLLRYDFSAETDAFREELLARCLEVLDADTRSEASELDADCHVVELNDADLELLAAAGDTTGIREPRIDGKA